MQQRDVCPVLVLNINQRKQLKGENNEENQLR